MSFPTEPQIELAGYLLTRETTLREELEADPKVAWFAIATTSLDDIMGLTPYRSGYADIADYERVEDLIDAKEARKNWYCDQQDEFEEYVRQEEQAHAAALKRCVLDSYEPLRAPLPL